MLSLLTLSGLLVLFADPTTADEADEDTRRLQFMKESVVGYQIQSEAGEPIELYAEPVLRWNNPVSGVKDGIIAMWTLDGRPAVLGQVFQARTGTWLHEFQSVAETPIAANRDGQSIWTPEAAGVEMRPLTGAPEPASNAVRRLLQMRQLAGRFSAVSLFKIDAGDTERTPYDLRLMSRPLYRYGDAETNLKDGALFAFAQGTNPEVWLLLEARQTDSGLAWHYGMAPMTGYAVTGKLDEETVLDVPQQPPAYQRSPKLCYLCIGIEGE